MRYPLIFALISVSMWNQASAQITFVPGDYYSSNASSTVTQYDGAGSVVGSAVMRNEVHGITFGPDGLLYENLDPFTGGFNVLALNGSGVVQQTYASDFSIGGNLTSGKITVDNQYLYVAGGDTLIRFQLGNPSSGTIIYTNNQVFDSVVLPNGNLLVASAYQVQEITNAGAVVRTLTLKSADNLPINDIRGLAYNPSTNDLFVTELGHTDSSFQLLKYNATTGALEKSTTFIYGDDIQLTLSGALLVGSAAQNPTFFDQNLNPLGTLHGGQQIFVTQLVPEPSVLALLVIGLGAAAVWHFRRRQGPVSNIRS